MNKNFSLLLAAGLAVVSQSACNAQSSGYKKLPSGVEYKIVKDKPGRTPQQGDYIELHILTKFRGANSKDTVLFDSRLMNNNQPVPAMVQKPQFGGDIMEAFTYLSEGDSAVIRTPLDSMLKMGMPMSETAGMAKNKKQKVDYYVTITKVRSADQMRKEAEEKSAQQNAIDDKLLQEYFAKNGIKAQRTPSGIYYRMDKPGSGPALQPGQMVTMNYTGKLLDGTAFDSNVDPKFQHVQPFQFALGTGQVIRGWDEGVALFKKGGKGTLYIPSSLAYGERSPSPAIPANSVMMFDVEVVDAAAPGAQPQMQMVPQGHSEHDGHNH